jgi:pimeloyl-ACP methyl ester carboxylesterase
LSVSVGGRCLEFRTIAPAAPGAATIVFLHEGLGSAGLWRDFPDRVAAATGCGALVYSRRGYGGSDPFPGPWPVSYMHEEAGLLPAVLAHFAIERPVLFGHSDGASIALLHAAAHPRAVRALVLEAPHVFVEPVCRESIARLAGGFETGGLRQRLARHHGANADPVFHAWAGVWLHPEFARWNLEACLPRIAAPVLVIQGEDDEYGTARQVEAIVGPVGGPARALLLSECGHAPHRDRPEAVLAATVDFLAGLAGPG